MVFYLLITLHHGLSSEFSYLTNNLYFLFIVFSFNLVMVFFIFLFYFYCTSLFFRSGSELFIIIIVALLYFVITYLITIKFFCPKIIPQSVLVTSRALEIILLSIIVFINLIHHLMFYYYFFYQWQAKWLYFFRCKLRSVKYNFFFDFFYFKLYNN